MRAFWFLLVLAGCHPSSVAVPDVPDPPDDSAEPSRGLFVAWRATPALPGPLSDGLTVIDAEFQLDHLQVISDAGSQNTTRSRYMVSWNAGGGPAQEAFPEAPAGVYSKISLAMMGGGLGEFAYRINGTWKAGDDTIVRYEILDRLPLIIMFNCDETLSAGGMAQLTIELELKDAIEGIDFEGLWQANTDLIEIKDGMELQGFRDRLKRAFKAEAD